jgi:hypothetical protein
MRNQPAAKPRHLAAIGALIIVAATGAAVAASTGVPLATVATIGAAVAVPIAVTIDILRDSGVRGTGDQGETSRSLPELLSGVLRRAAWGGVDPATAGLMAGAGWRLMRAAACMMPTAAGRRWLAEAESFLAEAPPVLRRGAIGSYLAGAPQVIVVSWAACLARRARGILSGPASR